MKLPKELLKIISPLEDEYLVDDEQLEVTSSKVEEENADEYYIRLQRVRDEIAKLNLIQRGILLAYVDSGCNLRRTAERVGLSDKTARKSIRATMEILTNNLKDMK